MMRRLTFAALLLLFIAARASAANSCSAYASGIAFGSYYGSVVDITGTITVTCTSGRPMTSPSTPGWPVAQR